MRHGPFRACLVQARPDGHTSCPQLATQVGYYVPESPETDMGLLRDNTTQFWLVRVRCAKAGELTMQGPERLTQR